MTPAPWTSDAAFAFFPCLTSAVTPSYAGESAPPASTTAVVQFVVVSLNLLFSVQAEKIQSGDTKLEK